MSINGVSLKTYAGQSTGLEWQIAKNIKLAKALASPGEYMLERNKQIEGVRDTLNDQFRIRYNKYIASGLSPRDAKDRTEHVIQQMCDVLMNDLALDYPDTVDGAAANVVWRSNPAVRQGFTNTGGKHVPAISEASKGFKQ